MPTRQITVPIAADDAPAFIARLQALVNGVVHCYQPDALILIKINNWFGERWLGFSGKVARGTVGWWKGSTVPPFVPNRVVSQRRFEAPSYEETQAGPPVHKKIRSGDAANRWIWDLPGAPPTVIWYSGQSEKTGQAAVMVYAAGTNKYFRFYVAWSRAEGWQLKRAIDINRRDLEDLIWKAFETAPPSTTEETEGAEEQG